MLISCPKCHSVYNVAIKNIPESGKKFKCAECKLVWTVYPEDVSQDTVEESHDDKTVELNADELNAEKNNEKEIKAAKEQDKISDKGKSTIDEDINVMMNRLSVGTKNLFASNSAVEYMTPWQRFKHNFKNSFSPTALYALLSLIMLALFMLILYTRRHDIVARFPTTQAFYDMLNIDSLYTGRDLLVDDVAVNSTVRGGKYEVYVSGRLYNSGNFTVRIPQLKVTGYNQHGIPETEIIEQLPTRVLRPGYRLLFNIVLPEHTLYRGKIKVSMDDSTN